MFILLKYINIITKITVFLLKHTHTHTHTHTHIIFTKRLLLEYFNIYFNTIKVHQRFTF